MKRFVCYILLVLSCMLASCVRGLDLVEKTGRNQIEVPVSFSLQGESLPTRGIVDESITDMTQISKIIRNIWVIQYDGISEDAALIGEPQYIADMSSFDGKLSLVESASENRIVVIANTFDPLMTFPQASDYGDLKARFMSVEDELSFMPSSGQDNYLIFSGSIVARLDDPTSALELVLKRNVARIDVTIINSSEEVTINSWQLRSVPSVSYYLNDYTLPDEFPSVNNMHLIDFPLQRPASSLTPPGQDAEPVKVSFTTYLPVNKRGVAGTDDTPEYMKNFNAPGAATYLQINATYSEDGYDYPIQYSFYLGRNLNNDFNLLPNHAYSYEFNITRKGDVSSDHRVKDLGLVDFTQTELANCYIINPAQTEGVPRKFRIPVARVEEFWGGGNYESNPNYSLGSSVEWEVRVIATNFDNSDGKVELTKASGTGSLDVFELTVQPKTTGSAIVALYKKNQSLACWSWHLWITDYAPDEAYLKTPIAGEYEYRVTGGAVHRYQGSIWNGAYKRRFIMDRNLGAMGLGRPSGGNGTGSMYFQYGRKDPIFGSASYGYKGVFNKFSYKSIVDNDKDPKASLFYSINYPLIFITGGLDKDGAVSENGWGAWTIGNKYCPEVVDTDILWMDPNPVEKSIFDPCPPGYCVPDAGVWSDFNSSTTNVNNPASPFPAFGSINSGVYYWPLPHDKIPESPVYYPASGIIQGTGSNSGTTTVYSVTSRRALKTTMSSMSITSSLLSLSRGDIAMNLACPVRCVTVRDVNVSQ